MKTRYAKAICNFSITEELRSEALRLQAPCNVLSLITGDRMCVLASDKDWCYGHRIGWSREAGIFPLNAVVFVERQPKEVVSTDGNTLVREINQVAQQWWMKIKDVYSKHAEMYYLDEVLDYIDDMLVASKKILSGDVPSEELNKLRVQITRKIDRGNLLLSLGVVIRQKSGIPYDPDSISILQTYHEHQLAEKNVGVEIGDVDSLFDAFSVLLSVQSIDLKMKNNCEVSLVLFDIDRKHFVSDTFSFIWKHDTVTSSRNLNIRAIFANFSREDFGRKLVLISRVAHIAPIEYASSTTKKGQEAGPANQFCRQVFAVDFLDLSYVFDNPQPSNDAREKLIFLNKDQDFDQAFKSLLVTGRVPKFNTSSDDIKLLISTQVLAGNVSEIRQKKPHLFNRSPPAIIQKTSEFVQGAGDVRNDLYVTIQNGELYGKSSDRNIEARMNVIQSNGSILEDCFESIGPMGIKRTSDYRSYVFYHQDKPCWMEQLKIRLPESACHELHLRIALHSKKPYDKSKAEKGPFAIAYLRLLANSAVVQDEDHELLVYKIESSHYDPNNTTYTDLPQTRKILKELGSTNKPHSAMFSLSEKSFIQLNTKSCSAVLSQNAHVINVLRWKTNATNVKASLIALASPVGDVEAVMMRFLCPLLDALFEIWEKRGTPEEALQLQMPVFDVIVVLFKLVDEPRNASYAEDLQKYLDRFSYCSAALKLLSCLNHYIESAATNNNDKTRNSLKVMGRVFEVIVCSKKRGDRFLNDDSYSTEFCGHLEGVLASLVRLMSETRDRMTVQNTALKHLPSIIDPILRSDAFEPNDLCNFLDRLIRGFGKNIVARERLGFVAQLIDTQLFEQFSSRYLLLPQCLDLLLVHLDSTFSEEKEFSDRAAECASIIASLIERLFPCSVPKGSTMSYGSDDELNMIISLMYRPIVQAMVIITRSPMSHDVDARPRFFTLILALLNKMSAQIFDNYLKNLVTIIDKMDFVLEMIQMIRDLLSKCPFASTWQHMTVLQNKTVHKALRFLMSAVQTYFSNESFYSEVWEEYMMTMVCFVTQSSLQLNEDWLKDETDVRFILRKGAAKDLRSMWFCLSSVQKMEYIPRLVGAFLEVALVEDYETREATIPIFFDMMQCEFHLDPHRDFKRFSDELITKLDVLVDQNCGTRAFQEQFTRILTDQCKSDKELWAGGGRDLIKRVDQLLGYLFEYRHARELSECIDNTMSRIEQLMRYYHEFEHHNLYITYIYKLYDLHKLYNNDLEAAKTLMLHANMLKFEDTELSDFLVTRCLNQNCATERQLKDQLLSRAAELFAEGHMWEDAIQIHRKLSPEYESTYVDYEKMATVMERIAGLYRRINLECRTFFYFYLVTFYGKGFPSYLNGKRFVFRSEKLERLADFLPRMQQLYGGPETIPSMDDCSQLENSPGRFIQVFNVDPIPVQCPFDSNVNVNPYIKEYYRHYNIKDFEFSRLVQKKDTKWTSIEDSDLMRTWIVKRRLVTYEQLPSVLRASKVISCGHAILISPLRRSVDQMERKNRDLMETAWTVLHNEQIRELALKKLSGEVIGVVNANVQGGIKNYEVFFTDESSKIYEPEDKQLAMRLSALIVEQVEILEYCIYAYSSGRDTDPNIHELLINGFLDHKKYVEDKFGRTRSILPPGASIRVSSLAPTDGHESYKKAASSSNFMDIGATPTGTLKMRGAAFGSTMLNMLTPTRKMTSGVPQSPTAAPLLSKRSTSTVLETGHIRTGMRQDSRDSLHSNTFVAPLGISTLRRATNSSSDGIRFRPPVSRDSLVPPPLPSRSAQQRSASPDRLDRSVLLGEKHSKPPVPTPIMD